MTIIASDIGGRIVVLPSPVERPVHARPRVRIKTKQEGGTTTMQVTLDGLSRADIKKAKDALKCLATSLRYIPVNHEAAVFRILKRQRKEDLLAARAHPKALRRASATIGRKAARA
jgi:hypothetical protein